VNECTVSIAELFSDVENYLEAENSDDDWKKRCPYKSVGNARNTMTGSHTAATVITLEQVQRVLTFVHD
jgi:hypothetical protein